MIEQLWGRAPAPEADVGDTPVWCSVPATAGELTADRARLRETVRRTAAADADALDCLLLAFEELGSNGLRHGRPPVTVRVVATAQCWLLDVSDAAADHVPAPAVGRDPAEGGLGLYLIARMAAAHGWYTEEGRKHVWACLPTGPDASAS